MTDQPTLDRAPQRDEALRLLRAAVGALFPGNQYYAVRLDADGTDDGEPWIEVGDGLAALEPVEMTMTGCRALGGDSHQVINWRVYQQVDASDPSVGLYGTEFVEADPQPHSSGHTQEGCYCYLTDAIRHIVHDLVDQIVNNAVENEGYTIAYEKGEL